MWHGGGLSHWAGFKCLIGFRFRTRGAVMIPRGFLLNLPNTVHKLCHDTLTAELRERCHHLLYRAPPAMFSVALCSLRAGGCPASSSRLQWCRSNGAPWPQRIQSRSAFLWARGCSGPAESKWNLECEPGWGVNPSPIPSKLTSRGGLKCRCSTRGPPRRRGEVSGRSYWQQSSALASSISVAWNTSSWAELSVKRWGDSAGQSCH